MKLKCSQVDHVGVAVLVVLLCGELSYKVEGVTTDVQLYNVGDDITLNCFPPANDYNYNSWYRNGTFLANRNGISYLVADHHISQNYTPYHTNSESLYSLYIYNAEILDSASYLCVYNNDRLVKQYDVRIIGCTCIITNRNNNDKEKVFCELENYWAVNSFQLEITINLNINKNISIQGNSFSFAMSRHQLYNSLHFELQQLYNNAISNIRCMLPAQFTSPYPSIRYPTTPLIPITTQNGQREASYTTSQEPITGVAVSTAGHHTRQNKNLNQGKNLSNSDITMITVISGSVFILILIVLIFVVLYKQTKHRQENKHNDIASVHDKDTKENPEVCYESVDDESERGPRNDTSLNERKEIIGDPANDSNKIVITIDNYMSLEGTSSSRGPNSSTYMELMKEKSQNTSTFPHDYIYVSSTIQDNLPESTQEETSLNHLYDTKEYVNSMIKRQPKRKGVTPTTTGYKLYDDVAVQELGNDIAEDTFYSHIK